MKTPVMHRDTPDPTQGAAAAAVLGATPADHPAQGLGAALLTLGLAYLLAAELSLQLSRTSHAVASVWYANAVAVAILHGQPLRRWPALLVVLAVVNPLANVAWGDPWAVAASFAPANVAEVALAAWLLQRHGPRLTGGLSPGGLVRVLLLGGVVPQLLGATLGALTMSAHGFPELTGVWLPWFSGSTIGALSVLPLGLLLVHGGRVAVGAIARDYRNWALLPLAVGTTLASVVYLPFPFVSATLPLLLAAGLVPLGSVALLTLAASVTMAYAMGRGLFLPPPQAAEWEIFYVYLALALTLLPGQLLSAAISELRQSREQLALSTASLKTSNDSLEQFVRIAAHDLREPLNTVASFGQLLDQRCGPALDAQGRQFLHYMLQGSERMRTVLDDVLQFVHVQQGQRPAMERVALQAVLDQAVQALTRRMTSSGAVLQGRLEGEVMGQPVLLSLVLQNLLQNAMKFMPADRRPVIEVSAERRGAHWCVHIADNGIGIAAEDLPRLFQPFHRLHTRRLYDGTGLGLALAQQIIQAHGGRISVRSTPGEGSCFSLLLPAAQP